MAKEYAKAFYNTKAWQACREAFIKYRISVDGGMCESCGEELGYIVHHTIQLTPDNINNPEITLSFNHLKYECKKCHDKEENHFKPTKKKRYNFDENGKIMEGYPPCQLI